VGDRFITFVDTYAEHFQSYRHDVTEKARQYACGLMQAGSRKNMDRMAGVVPGSKSRNLQQFLAHSKWRHKEVIDHVAQDVDNLLGDEHNACFLIDESGFAKQGNMSVGVSRQWLGRFGKVNNCQVAVFGTLANGQFVAPVDVRLYLPEKWTNDPNRCERACVPENERKFRTKIELALEMVRHARENGCRYGWVGSDAGYTAKARNPALLLRKWVRRLLSMCTRIFVYTRKIQSLACLKKLPTAGGHSQDINRPIIEFTPCLNFIRYSTER
jgi:SRSO17 transposase